MSKEEKVKRILTTTGYTTEANKHEVLFYIEELERNNFKLQARADKYKCRIDKAIEYIENTRVDNTYMVQEKYEHLLEILDFHQ